MLWQSATRHISVAFCVAGSTFVTIFERKWHFPHRTLVETNSANKTTRIGRMPFPNPIKVEWGSLLVRCAASIGVVLSQQQQQSAQSYITPSSVRLGRQANFPKLTEGTKASRLRFIQSLGVFTDTQLLLSVPLQLLILGNSARYSVHTN